MFDPVRPIVVNEPPLKSTKEPCWTCGEKAKTDDQDRVLCDTCRAREIRGVYPVVPGPFRTPYTAEEYLRWCFRCTKVEVSKDDPLGLCPDCSEELRHG